MLDNKTILTKIGNEIVSRLGVSLDKYRRTATGDTKKSLESISEPNRLRILAREHIQTLEYGRDPTPGTNVMPSREFVAKIQRWLDARGKSWSAFAVARSIHKKGFVGTPGVLTDVINDQLFSEIADEIGDEMKTNVIRAL